MYLLFLILINLSNIASNQHTGNLIIKLDKPVTGGNLLVYMYDKPETFPRQKDKVYRLEIFPCKENLQTISIENIRFNEYAIIVVHDQNGNKKMDRNWLGLPAENYALSGNPKFHMGPPVFDEVRFSFNTNNQVLQLHF